MSGAVIVTGASSFMGLHLGQAFAAAGWRVVATHSQRRDRYDGLQGQRLDRLSQVCRLVQCNLRDAAAVAGLIVAESPALWLHHAGHATGYASPEYDLTTGHAVNVATLEPVYRALAGSGAGVIVTGSSMEYGAKDGPNVEEDACCPDTPYGLSKLCETLRARQLADHYGVPTRVARLFIPVGPLDNPRKLLPQVVTALRTGTPIDLSPCEQRRDFAAAEDICAGYLSLAADLPRLPFDIFNLCSGEAVALRSLLLGIAADLGADPELLRFGALPLRPGEPPVSVGDNAKAAALLDWRPRTLARLIADLAQTLV